MKTRQKYDKKTLKQYDWLQLLRLQSKLANRKMVPVAVINAFVSILNILIRDPHWVKTSIMFLNFLLMVWILVLIVRYIRIDRIMDEK